MFKRASCAALMLALLSSTALAQVPVLNPVTPLTGTAGPSGSATPVSPSNPLPVTPGAATTGGWTLHEDDALTNTAVAIKASGGQLGKLYCYNPNASVVYIQTYNVAAGSVTVGTTAHAQSYGIPATNAAGFSISPGDQYSTAISYAATTTPSGSGQPGTALTCNVSYN
jgi:hypothetical protein